jgi:hypothetical protein
MSGDRRPEMAGICTFIEEAKDAGADRKEYWTIKTADGETHRGPVVEVRPDCVVISKRVNVMAGGGGDLVHICIAERAIISVEQSAEE